MEIAWFAFGLHTPVLDISRPPTGLVNAFVGERTRLDVWWDKSFIVALACHPRLVLSCKWSQQNEAELRSLAAMPVVRKRYTEEGMNGTALSDYTCMFLGKYGCSVFARHG